MKIDISASNAQKNMSQISFTFALNQAPDSDSVVHYSSTMQK